MWGEGLVNCYSIRIFPTSFTLLFFLPGTWRGENLETWLNFFVTNSRLLIGKIFLCSVMLCWFFSSKRFFFFGIANPLPPRQNYNGPSLWRDLLSNLITFFLNIFLKLTHEKWNKNKIRFASINSNYNCKQTPNWWWSLNDQNMSCYKLNSKWFSIF